MYALVVDDRRSPHKIYNQPNYRVHVYNRVLGAGAYAISLIRMRSADTLSRILIIISLIRVVQLVARWPLNSVRSHELIRSEMRWKISANRKINVKFPICIYFMQVSWVDAVEAMTFSSVLCSRWNFFFLPCESVAPMTVCWRARGNKFISFFRHIRSIECNKCSRTSSLVFIVLLSLNTYSGSRDACASTHEFTENIHFTYTVDIAWSLLKNAFAVYTMKLVEHH